MNVKEWQPVEGCESCKQAIRLFHEHTNIAAHTNAMAIKHIRELKDQIAELEAEVAELKATVAWLDNNSTFCDNGKPVLAEVTKRIWYHATDDVDSYPFSAVIQAALKEQP